jgi:hypothetical protein
LRQTLRKALGSLTHHEAPSLDVAEEARRRNKRNTVFETDKVMHLRRLDLTFLFPLCYEPHKT